MHAINSIELNKFIADGKMEIAIHQLVDFCEKFQTSFNQDVFHLAGRFRDLEKERYQSIVSIENYKLQCNTIRRDLLQLVTSFESAKDFNKVPAMDEMKHEIEKMALEFDNHHKIAHNPTRLRLKNHCCKRIAEKLAQNPVLIPIYQTTTSQAIICGIAEKIKRYPSVNDLEILAKIAPNATKKFTKGTIVTTVAEIIYAGQLLLGDEYRLKNILDSFSKNPNLDKPLKKNIESAKASLAYFTKQLNQK